MSAPVDLRAVIDFRERARQIREEARAARARGQHRHAADLYESARLYESAWLNADSRLQAQRRAAERASRESGGSA